jgi:hypothetical protein
LFKPRGTFRTRVRSVTEVAEDVGHALHLAAIVVDAKITLDEDPELGIEVEGMSLTVVKNCSSMTSQTYRAVQLRSWTMSWRSTVIVPNTHESMMLSIRRQRRRK